MFLENAPSISTKICLAFAHKVLLFEYEDKLRLYKPFYPSRTRPDLVLFWVLGGTDFRVGFLGVIVSSRTLPNGCVLNRPLDASHETCNRGKARRDVFGVLDLWAG